MIPTPRLYIRFISKFNLFSCPNYVCLVEKCQFFGRNLHLLTISLPYIFSVWCVYLASLALGSSMHRFSVLLKFIVSKVIAMEAQNCKMVMPKTCFLNWTLMVMAKENTNWGRVCNYTCGVASPSSLLSPPKNISPTERGSSLDELNVSIHEEALPNTNGDVSQLIGSVQRKPGRGDTTLSVSCSVKMARWSSRSSAFILSATCLRFFHYCWRITSRLWNGSCGWSLETSAAWSHSTIVKWANESLSIEPESGCCRFSCP